MASPADELADEFFREAEDHVAAMGRRLGEGADQELRRMTARAAEALLNDGPDNLSGRVQEARRAFFELLDKAEELARDIPDYPSDCWANNPSSLRETGCALAIRFADMARGKAPSTEGLKAAADITKQIIALSTGAVAFTITFLEKFNTAPAGESLKFLLGFTGRGSCSAYDRLRDRQPHGHYWHAGMHRSKPERLVAHRRSTASGLGQHDPLALASNTYVHCLPRRYHRHDRDGFRNRSLM